MELQEYDSIVKRGVEELHRSNPSLFTTSFGTNASYYTNVFHLVNSYKKTYPSHYKNTLLDIKKQYGDGKKGTKGYKEELSIPSNFIPVYKELLHKGFMIYLTAIDNSFKILDNMDFTIELQKKGKYGTEESKSVALAEYRYKIFTWEEGGLRLPNTERNLYAQREKGGNGGRKENLLATRTYASPSHVKRMDRVQQILGDIPIVSGLNNHGIQVGYNNDELVIVILVKTPVTVLKILYSSKVFKVYDSRGKGTLLSLGKASFGPPSNEPFKITELHKALDIFKTEITTNKYGITTEQHNLINQLLVKVYDMRYRNIVDGWTF